jgi:hypothetical protein
MQQNRKAWLGLAALVFSLGAAAQTAPLPKLDLLITPQYDGKQVSAVGMKLEIQEPKVEAGKVLLKMPTSAVSITVPAYAPEAIEASDQAGKLTLTTQDEPPTPSMALRQYLVNRATVGNVTVRYTGRPRVVDEQTRNGPLYDLRSEAGGILGGAMYFMALPPDDRTFQISLDWDLSQLPAGMRGVWSLGEGRQTLVGTTYKLFLSGVAIGDVKSLPEDGRGQFAVYWLSNPPFDMKKLASESAAIHGYMAKFFKDTGSSYHVFARRNPYPAGGGSGWTQSFIFGYGPGGESASGGDMQMLLAHEIAHNWPRLDGTNLSDTAWYTEGTAEYYSSLLAYRAGLIGLDKFVALINEKAAGYASNPFKDLSNADAGKKFWEDARAQRIPYGRGFMYLLRLNAQIQEHSKGKRSVDDLVREVIARQQADQKVGVVEWRALVEAELGAQGGREFDDMVSGKDIIPPANALAACLKLSKYQYRPFELGFDEMSLAVVRGLRKGSAAEAAGLVNGDRIAISNIVQARTNEDTTLDVAVNRDGKEQKVSFVPRTKALTAWRWEKLPTAQSACRL